MYPEGIYLPPMVGGELFVLFVVGYAVLWLVGAISRLFGP